MKKIRTLVVDDEPLARARIVNLLRKNEQIALIGECKNGYEAMDQISNYKPDLVFLDIQMPDLNGFDVLSKIDITPLPFIIFVTAYDQYALKAFDVHAVDYLLKPYDDDRFHQALEHAKHQIQLKQNAFIHQKMVSILNEYTQSNEDGLIRLEYKEKGKTHFINIYDIYYIESHGNYIKVFLREKSVLLRQTLQSLEEQLDSKIFLRIHRSTLVNCNFVHKIRYEGNNQYLFLMKNEASLLSSRGYKPEVLQYLEEEEIKRKLTNFRP